MMEVTSVYITKIEKTGKVLAHVRIVLNNLFVINGIKIVEGKFGPFITYPRFYDAKEGKGYDVCYPLSKELARKIAVKILEEYNK